jgi:hypothetical protein
MQRIISRRAHAFNSARKETAPTPSAVRSTRRQLAQAGAECSWRQLPASAEQWDITRVSPLLVKGNRHNKHNGRERVGPGRNHLSAPFVESWQKNISDWRIVPRIHEPLDYNVVLAPEQVSGGDLPGVFRTS